LTRYWRYSVPERIRRERKKMSDKEEKSFKTTDKRQFDDTGRPKSEAREEKKKESSDKGFNASTSSFSSPPKIDFITFIMSLHTSTLISLGIIPAPGDDKPSVNLELAGQNIDMIEMIKEKTKGNLTDPEKQVLDNSLYELRMKYIEIKKSTTKSS
jgi:hypothetical protein